MYLPGNGILFDDGIHATIGGTGGVTITFLRKMDLEYYSDILQLRRGGDVQPPKTKKYFRSTKSGAGMTAAGVARYRRENPGSKLKTAVTGKVKPGSKADKRRKSFCARSAGQMKKFPKAAKDPNSRLRQARRRWKC